MVPPRLPPKTETLSHFPRNRGAFKTVIDSGLVGSTDFGRGTVRAEDAQGTPTQSHISPSILVYEEKTFADEGVPSAGDAQHVPGERLQRLHTMLTTLDKYTQIKLLRPWINTHKKLTTLDIKTFADAGVPSAGDAQHVPGERLQRFIPPPDYLSFIVFYLLIKTK